eukprot:CAMPEP_0198670884 /NCGR_PEP_ID=MMETSP1467-20131203/83378_1 /TAXON_ID=1462469 /ORGANISM="unid. sp., Strain CCMP2135" /LENGTH=83 /DNA_ID=CAMNT_0044407669 /DNA_START=29 /DNA_END=276 /DNA_ORIENTATION=-
MADKVAPVLCGMAKSFLGDDAAAEERMRRGFLAVTERFWADSERWAPHVRVKAFVRKWFLDARYRRTDRYALAASALRTTKEL